MRRYLLIALTLVSVAIGPMALGATPTERAITLAELRAELPDLKQQLARAEADLARATQSLKLSSERLDAVLADRLGALDQLADVESELRAARASLDEGIERLYIRGGTAALTVVMFFNDPTEAGIATRYLEAVSDHETESLGDIDRLISDMSDLRYTAFEAVEAAQNDYRDHERTYLQEAVRVADLESEVARLAQRVEGLTAEWRQYRLDLAASIIETTGATGVLAEDTIAQAGLRASLPLGPTVGIPPGLESSGRTLKGVASWYGPGFHGRRASSGAIFDERDFTIAHKTLRHETLLLVTYGDKQAVVMVNDRGPFIEGRDFDLSRATAEYLGLGLGTVTAEILVVAP